MTDTWVVSAPVLDELVADDGAVLLVGDDTAGHRVLRITVLGREIRDAAKDGILLPELVQSLIERLGPPGDDVGDAAALVEAALQALAVEGVVVIREGAVGQDAAASR